jgi:hypothetical protein
MVSSTAYSSSVKPCGYSVSVQRKQNSLVKKVYGYASQLKKTLNSIFPIIEDGGHTQYSSHGKAHSPVPSYPSPSGAEAV